MSMQRKDFGDHCILASSERRAEAEEQPNCSEVVPRLEIGVGMPCLHTAQVTAQTKSEEEAPMTCAESCGLVEDNPRAVNAARIW